MSNFEKGLKAGIISGIIFGISIYSIQYIIERLTLGYDISYSLIFMVITGGILGSIFGTVIGIIFAKTYKKLPGTSSMVKAIIISIFAWIFFSFLIPFILSSGYSYFSDNFVRNGMSSQVFYIFFGIMLGLLWDKFTEMEKTCSKCQRVVPKDANLCPYCGKKFNINIKKVNKETKLIRKNLRNF